MPIKFRAIIFADSNVTLVPFANLPILDVGIYMKQRLSPLTNSYFVLSLIILLTNDFYLKYEYHNWITGKLSDITGLFVFVYFWTVIFPRQKSTIYILSGLTFVYWKSAYSQPLITFFSEYIYTIDRTVDMSDLIALMVLPIAYSASRNERSKLKMEPIPVALLTIFSFCATSVPKPTQMFDDPEYVLFGVADFEYVDNFPNEFKVYHLDSMKVVAVTRIETERVPASSDDYYKSQILADLDLRVLSASKDNYGNDTDLDSYRSLRDSLTIAGTTSIRLDLDSVSDELNFRGTRLNGPFRRYSKENALLTEGRYKDGIRDSIWSFYDGDKKIASRRYFVAGELTMIERFENEKIVSTTGVNTRKDVITKQYVVLTLIGVVLILIAIRLFLNFRASDKKTFVRMSTFEAVSQIILLPTIMFTIAKVISGFISDSHSDMFQLLGQFMLANIFLMPILAVVVYGLRLRRRFDLILYILLFTFTLIWIDEFRYLKQILL